MKIIRNNIFPFKGFKAVNIFGYLFCRKNAVIKQQTINHESIHTAQMKELLYVPFYLIYFFEWLYRLWEYREYGSDAAYQGISFEREANEHQWEDGYLSTRRHFAQWR